MAGTYETIDGFRCYAPAVANDGADYPLDGFDVTAELEARSFWCRARNRILRDVFEAFTDHSRQIDVLDIGCGIGGVVRALSALPHLRLTGSEIYVRGLRYARMKLPAVEFIQLDATDIPFHDAYDAVGAFDVLEHIEADERVIDQVRHALRPGGLFVVTVPQYPWMWSRLDNLVHHKRRYTRAELVGKLEAAGFAIEYATSFVSALFPFMLASRVVSRFRAATDDHRQNFATEVTLPPLLNRLFDWVMRVEEVALRRHISLPFGGSLLVVARRPSA
jgi:SAM-dependent methyltransferase